MVGIGFYVERGIDSTHILASECDYAAVLASPLYKCVLPSFFDGAIFPHHDEILYQRGKACIIIIICL